MASLEEELAAVLLLHAGIGLFRKSFSDRIAGAPAFVRELETAVYGPSIIRRDTVAGDLDNFLEHYSERIREIQRRSDNPTLELQGYIMRPVRERYWKLIEKYKSWCSAIMHNRLPALRQQAEQFL
ncbi:hypothetical protein IP69_01700 [Bosea sp. AAP35]|nr:hypothetical protein IP69_01700 [Bosea sp. AAP35]